MQPLRRAWNLGNGKWNMFVSRAVRLSEWVGRSFFFFFFFSQTGQEELPKVNIMRLNKASNLFFEALLIASVQTYRDFIDGFSPSIKWGITGWGWAVYLESRARWPSKWAAVHLTRGTAGSIFAPTLKRQTKTHPARNYSSASGVKGVVCSPGTREHKDDFTKWRCGVVWLGRRVQAHSCLWFLSRAYAPGTHCFRQNGKKKRCTA